MPPVKVYPSYGLNKKKRKNKHFLFHDDFLEEENKNNIAQPSDLLNQQALSPAKLDTSKVSTNQNQKKKKILNIQSVSNIYQGPRYRVFSKLFELNYWRPEMRESATFSCEGLKGYFYGGISSKVFDELCVLDLDRLIWNRVTQTGDIPSYGRFGHSCVIYNKSLYIFGGEKKYNEHLKQRECLSDIKVLNLEKFQWKHTRATGEIVTPRRNHAASLAGRFMVVSGGISYKELFLSDYWSFDCTASSWKLLSAEPIDPNGRAFHTSCPVFLPNRGFFELYKSFDNRGDNKNFMTPKYEGIYLFGGKNGKGDILGNLEILLTDRYPMKVLSPEISGTGPSPRYLHSMTLFFELGMIVISGGKNDHMKEHAFFGDMFILDIYKMQWVGVNQLGDELEPRGAHIAFASKTKLHIFGGFNESGYHRADMNITELEASNVRKLLLDEQKSSELKKKNDNDTLMGFGDTSKEISGKKRGSLTLKIGSGIQEGTTNSKKKIKKGNTKNFKNYARTEANEFDEELDKSKIKELLESLKFENFKSFLTEKSPLEINVTPIPEYIHMTRKTSGFAFDSNQKIKLPLIN